MPPSLRVEVDLDDLAEKPMITQGGSVHVGKVIVSAEGMTSDNVAYRMAAEDISFSAEGVMGRGSSGSVRRVRNKRTDQVMALKEIRITEDHRMKEIQRELETLNQGIVSQCPYLIDFFGAYSHEGSVFIAMECMDGSLGDCKKVPEPILAKMMKMVLQGLQYLHHERHLIHRDIKPSNILFNKAGRVKISDFGTSSQVEGTQAVAQTFVGTVTYMSLERLQGKPYTSSCDIWSLGVSAMELALGAHPFAELFKDKEKEDQGKFWTIIQYLSASDCPMHPSFSPDLRSFASQCLSRDVEQRPKATQLLQHPFITSNCASEEEDVRAVGAWLASQAGNMRNALKEETRMMMEALETIDKM